MNYFFPENHFVHVAGGRVHLFDHEGLDQQKVLRKPLTARELKDISEHNNTFGEEGVFHPDGSELRPSLQPPKTVSKRFGF